MLHRLLHPLTVRWQLVGSDPGRLHCCTRFVAALSGFVTDGISAETQTDRTSGADSWQLLPDAAAAQMPGGRAADFSVNDV
jgi:hypothetical protein